MRIYLFLFAFLVSLVLPDQAKAQWMTGAELSQSCGDTEQAQEIYRCLGYIAGVVDYHVVLQSLGTIPSTDFCLPEDLKVEEAAIRVLAYIKNKPEHAGFIAAPAIVMALGQVYPCTRRK